MRVNWDSTGTGESLKKFLQSKGVSHRLLTAVKHGAGAVVANGKKRNLDYKLSKATQVTLILDPEEGDPAVKPADLPLKVVFSNRDWLVVDKQAGVSSVPGPSDSQTTLVNRVKAYLIDQGAKDLRPHVITRLDRDTSGLVLVARHRLAQGLVTKDPARLDKRYLALVVGKLAKDHGFIDFPLQKDPVSPRQIVAATGKEALTEYWVTGQSQKATLVEVKLHTGRTHQIRAHFAAAGHPLVGDELYGGPGVDGWDRQALQCIGLKLADPLTGESFDWELKPEFGLDLLN